METFLCTVLLYVCVGLLARKISACDSTEFRCGNKVCISRDFVCNGKRNCKDGLDERVCNGTCADYPFTCPNGKCIATVLVCDGENDCGDEADEKVCSEDGKSYPLEFSCDDGVNSVPLLAVCDNEEDCNDGSDEENCKATYSNTESCPPWLFPCRNGNCLNPSAVCDGEKDCWDDSDEEFCETTMNCPSSTFPCKQGGCISSKGICVSPECTGYVDGKLCNGTCPEGYFTCLNMDCIPLRWKCDGVPQCYDESDEFNCMDLQLLWPIADTGVVEGGSVILRCYTYGIPEPSVTWWKGEENLSDGRYEVSKSGNLKIANVIRSDEGNYMCIAKNENGSVNGTGRLYVLEPSKFILEPVTTKSATGSTVIMNCIPKSDSSLKQLIWWSKDGKLVGETPSYPRHLQLSNNSLRIEGAVREDSGSYRCGVMTRLDIVSVTAKLTVDDVPESPENVLVNCSGRNAHISWKPVFDNTIPVIKYTVEYHNSAVPTEWQVVDGIPSTKVNATVYMKSPGEKYTFSVRAWSEIGSSERSSNPVTCSTPAEVPSFNPSNIYVRSDSSDSLIVSWDPIAKTDQNGPGFHYQVRWRVRGSNTWKKENMTEGRTTNLTVSKLASGKFYEVQVAAVNDVGAAKVEPASFDVFVGDVNGNTDGLKWEIILGMALLVVITMGVFIILSVFCLLERQRRKDLEAVIKEFIEGNQNAAEQAATPAEAAFFQPFTQIVEEKDVSVDYKKSLGSGNFGNVVAGTWKGASVAVKMVKPGSPVHAFEDFLKELKIMAYIGKHDHIVHFIGAVTSKLAKKTVLAVIELSPLGSLEAYLRKHETYDDEAEANIGIPDRTTNPVTPLPLETLISFCRQIAMGMQHLVEKTVIHGDLATRNVLVFEDDVVKISDFGFSRKTYAYGLYQKKSTCDLPYRWAALETIENFEFSHKADVWSYGVTMWEIFTLGHFPFAMEAVNDFAKRIRGGLRLPKPERTPDNIYRELMLKCWNLSPDGRPKFNEIIDFLNSLNGLTT